MRVLMGWIGLLSLCVVWAAAWATSTSSKSATWERPVWNGTRYADPDSGDVVRRYPSQEADTTGQGVDLSYYRESTTGDSIAMWYFTYQVGEVWDFYLNGVLIADISGRYLPGTRASEGLIQSSAAFAPGVVDSAAIAPEAVVGLLRAVTEGGVDVVGTGSTGEIEASRITATTRLQADGSTFLVEDGLITAGAEIDGTSLDMSAGATFDGNLTIGNADGDAHTVNGRLQITRGLAVIDAGAFLAGDSTWVYGRLDVEESAVIKDSLVVGADGDTATVHPVTGFARHLTSVSLTVGALATSATIAFPGATADMTFWGEIVSGSGTTIATNQIAVRYASPGHVTWWTSSLASSRVFRIYGRKF